MVSIGERVGAGVGAGVGKAQSVLNCGHACSFWLLASVRSVGR